MLMGTLQPGVSGVFVVVEDVRTAAMSQSAAAPVAK